MAPKLGEVEVQNVDMYFKKYWQRDTSVSELYASLVQSQMEAIDMQKVVNESQDFELFGRRGDKGILSYQQHLPVHLIESGVATGALCIGIFHVNKRDPLEAFVHLSNKGKASQLDISIRGRLLQNRALPGDLVAVRILELQQQLVQEDLLQGVTSIDDLTHPDALGDEEKLDMVPEAPKETVGPLEGNAQKILPTGEVVGILQSCQRDYVACLAEDDEELLKNSSRREYVLCVPMDRRVPMVRIATRLADRLVGQRFVIRIDGWDQDSRTPRGHFVKLLGPIGDLNAETMALLVENGINASPFSFASLQELPEDTEEHPWVIPEEEFAHRRDLRLSHRALSIDPPGSKDVDDALSVRRLPNKLLEIGVHIADVSYFVQQNSLVDLEARARGTTVYMVGKSWHMLPGVLSENLCSLSGGKDRLAVSVIWTVDPDNEFEVLDVWFGRTIIHSQHQMFYAQAQAILDGQTLPTGWELAGDPSEVAAVESDLLILANFSQVRRDLRRAQGALELASSEFRVETADNKEPISVDTKLELAMNWIVAELMILANSYVALKIYRAFPAKSLLRRHDPPRLDNFTILLQCCAARGFELDTSSNKALANSLDRMRDSNDPIVENAFRALATRAMSEAEYCSTGEAADPSGFYHYGLALNFYTHFTSPIRRYADVLVHRMLMASCERSSRLEIFGDEALSSIDLDSVLPGMELKEAIDHLNERYRASKRAQKECNELYLLMYLQKHANAEHAVVIGIHAKGITVFVPKYDIRAVVYLQDKRGNIILPAEHDSELNDSQEISSGRQCLVMQKGSMRIVDTNTGNVLQAYKLMDTVWVQLRADGSRAHAPKLRVHLLSPEHPAAKISISQRGSGNQIRAFLRVESLKCQSGQMKQVTRKVNKNKVVDDMVQIIATEEASSISTAMLKENLSLKRKEPSIHDVTEDFKKLKVSSVYLDVLEEYGISNILWYSDPYQMSENQSLSTSQKHFVNANWMPLTAGLNLALCPEEQVVASGQRLWRKTLRHAAKVRALRLRSVLQDNSQKQLHRSEKEKLLRRKANLFEAHLTDQGHGASQH